MLHVACGLTFLVFIISLFMLKRHNRVASLSTLIIGIIASIVTTVVFLIDVIVVAIVRNRVRDETDGDVTLKFGNGVRVSPRLFRL
jgi:amino acid permease